MNKDDKAEKDENKMKASPQGAQILVRLQTGKSLRLTYLKTS